MEVVPLSPRTYSTSDFSRKSGDMISDALKEPVTITQRNKPRLVLMNIKDYEKMREQGDPRRAMRIEDMDEEMLARFEEAIEAFAAEDDDGE
jgi:prevent-host-death family protein